MTEQISRRRFVKLGLLVAAGLGLTGCAHLFKRELKEPEDKDRQAKQPDPKPPQQPEEPAAQTVIPQRELGRTGRRVSVLGLGGAFAVARSGSPEESAALIERSLELGVNYIDTAPTYGDSEINIGRAIKHRRPEIFLASKTLDRTYDGTMRIFEQSLKRLQTDYLDLLHLHGIHHPAELEQTLQPGGAVAALEKLKSEGLIKFTGITGHKNPPVLLQGIKEYDFDCVMISLNAADLYYQPFQDEVLPVAKSRNMGIIAMKVAAYGRIFREGGITAMKDALGYVLSFPVATAVLGITTLEELEENVRLAASFTPLSAEELQHLERLVEPYWQEANFFKTQW